MTKLRTNIGDSWLDPSCRKVSAQLNSAPRLEYLAVERPHCCRAASFTSTEVVYGVTGTSVTELPEYGVLP